MGLLGIYVRTSIEKDNTSIEQQINEGIKFCKKNKFEYKVYEDEGISGFDVDDEQPFKDRRGLNKLINDIEDKIVDKVWIYENSRLSRNTQLSYVLNKVFKKNNVIIYEKDKVFDLNNPQNQMIQGILTNISQYERHLIVERTKRGLHDSINRGIRCYNQMYGYKKDGKKEDGYTKWIPVKSEIENLKYSYQSILKGSTVRSVIDSITKNQKLNGRQKNIMYKSWISKLMIFVYTGYSLTTEGTEIYNKFKRFEIDSLSELKNKKYYVKSVQYPIQIITVENWIKVVEKLVSKKKLYKDKMRNTDTDFLTGIVQCPFCELKYFVVNNGGYHYYRHFPLGRCKQKPKSTSVKYLNPLFELFYFYINLIFDDTRILIEENQKLNQLNQLELKDKIKDLETDNKKYEKQINRFQSIYEETNDKELLKLTLIKEKELNQKLEKNNLLINNLKSDLDVLNSKYDDDELLLTFHDVSKNVINFFEKMSIEEKRTSIIKIVKCCQLFHNYLLIDTGNLLFIFNIYDDNVLPKHLYENFKKDKNFKDNYLNSSKFFDNDGNLSDDLLEYVMNTKEELLKKYTEKEVDKIMKDLSNYGFVRTLDNIIIEDYPLNDKEIKSIKVDYEKELQKYGIDYNISGIDKIINFTRSIYFF